MAGTDWTAYCLTKPGAWIDHPWDEGAVVKVAEKIFAFFAGADQSGSIGLKCGDRDAADLMLARYAGASVMSYIGRYGWNTFPIRAAGEQAIDEDDMRELIDTSYDLVVARLPKSRRPPSP